MKLFLNLLLALSMGASAMGHDQEERKLDHTSITLEVTNLSFLQPFSPFFVMTHNAAVTPLFVLGEEASFPLAILAEDGNPDPLVEAYTGVAGTGYVGRTEGGIPPGMSMEITLPVDAAYPYVTIGSMFVNTNDGFVAINGRILNPGDVVTGVGYDAGSEENNEDCRSIPGPACTAESGNVRSGNGEEKVLVHRGFFGIGPADGTNSGNPLRKDRYDWRNPMMRVVVSAGTTS